MTEPLHDWCSLSESELRSYASVYVGWATNEMSDPKDLTWTLEAFHTSCFHAIETDWDAFFKDDVLANPQFEEGFENQDYHTPVVVSVENGSVIIWDGWHRIACSIHRGDEVILAIIGRLKEKA